MGPYKTMIKFASREQSTLGEKYIAFIFSPYISNQGNLAVENSHFYLRLKVYSLSYFYLLF